MNDWSKENKDSQPDITAARVKEILNQSAQPTVWSPDETTDIVRGPCIANPAQGAPLIVKLKTGEPVNEETTGLYKGGNLRRD